MNYVQQKHLTISRFLLQLVLLVAGLSVFQGCRASLDKALVSQMEQTGQQAQTELDSYATLVNDYNSFLQAMGNAPSDLRASAGGRVEEFEAQVSEYHQKLMAMDAQYRQQVERSKALLEEYRAGKADTEQTKAAFEPVRLELELIKTEMEPFREYLAALRKEFKTMIEAQMGTKKQ
jgi:DNA repair exonuclease SbcCD ATPase subunit